MRMSKDTRYPYRVNVMRQWVDKIKESRNNGSFHGRVVIEDTGHPDFVTIEIELDQDRLYLILKFC
jgi:hypothetical protein